MWFFFCIFIIFERYNVIGNFIYMWFVLKVGIFWVFVFLIVEGKIYRY